MASAFEFEVMLGKLLACKAVRIRREGRQMCDAGRNARGMQKPLRALRCRLLCALFLGIVSAQIKERPCIVLGFRFME